MNVRIIILNGAWLLSAVALVGCATPSKLQQAFSRNTSDDIGQTRVNRKEKLAQDFDHTRDDAQFDAAASSWERGDLEGCRRILEQLLDRNPNHPRARLMLADWYLFNGQAERSAEELNKALAIDPKNAMAHHSLAQVLEACGRRDEAMAQYRLATELEPNNQVYAQSCKMAIDLAPTAPPRELLAAQNSNLEDLKKSNIPDGSARPGRTDATCLRDFSRPPPRKLLQKTGVNQIMIDCSPRARSTTGLSPSMRHFRPNLATVRESLQSRPWLRRQVMLPTPAAMHWQTHHRSNLLPGMRPMERRCGRSSRP